MIKSVKVFSDETIDALPKTSESRKKIDKMLEAGFVPQLLKDLSNKIYKEMQEEKQEQNQSRGMSL